MLEQAAREHSSGSNTISGMLSFDSKERFWNLFGDTELCVCGVWAWDLGLHLALLVHLGLHCSELQFCLF